MSEILYPVITIDGPTASGKSTLAREIAQKLGYYYLNSGMLYRAVAFHLMQTHSFTERKLNDVQQFVKIVEASLRAIIYIYDHTNHEKIFLYHQDITPYLKDSMIDRASSLLATSQIVRKLIIAKMREIAHKHAIVTDGRDSGSIVFQDATVKLFVTASIGVRAARWQADQHKRGNSYSIQQAEQLVAERDRRDMQRTFGPLVMPVGATVIDTTDLSAEQTVAQALQIIGQKIAF